MKMLNYFRKLQEIIEPESEEDPDIQGNPQLVELLEWIGNILALLYFCTPLIQIIKLYKGSLNVKDIPIFLLLTILLNCLLWLLNAFSSEYLLDWVALLISNGIGLIINLAILFLYLNLYLERNLKKFLVFGIFVIDLLIEISYLMFRYIIFPEKKSDQEGEEVFHSIGLVATFINVLMYGSPIQNLIRLFKTGKSSVLPIFTLVVGFFTTMTFLLKGVISYNYFNLENDADERRNAFETIISNGLSFFLISCQIGFWVYFYFTKSPNQKMEDKTKNIENDSLLQ